MGSATGHALSHPAAPACVRRVGWFRSPRFASGPRRPGPARPGPLGSTRPGVGRRRGSGAGLAVPRARRAGAAAASEGGGRVCPPAHRPELGLGGVHFATWLRTPRNERGWRGLCGAAGKAQRVVSAHRRSCPGRAQHSRAERGKAATREPSCSGRPAGWLAAGERHQWAANLAFFLGRSWDTQGGFCKPVLTGGGGGGSLHSCKRLVGVEINNK